MTEPVKLTPTDEQAAVIEAVAAGDSVMVDALAGCTKSTTLEMAAPGVKEPALALAFNKKIQLTLDQKMPKHFTNKTFNGFGHGTLIRALPGVSKITLEDKKLGKLITQMSKDRKMELTSEQWDETRRLVTTVMQNGITPGDRGKPLAADTLDNWADIADGLWIDRESFEFIYELSREVLVESIGLVEKSGVISFDDQVYFPTCISGTFAQYPTIFVDEAQDLSPLNHAMLKQATRTNGRLVVVGDPKQAIYAFRGADSKSMSKIRALRQSWTDRGLMTTFRCPKLVVARQQFHAPGYKAWHSNTEGVVRRFAPGQAGGQPGFDLEEGWTWGDAQALFPHPQCTVMVLCRNNSPLMSLAFRLIRAQIGVVMLGRDIGKGLVTLSRKVLPEDATGRIECSKIVADWIETESSLARANGHEERVAGITDRGECLLAVIDSGCRDAGELRQMLTKLFARENGQVQLSTIHRAKGLEADCVIHLDPWRIPSKFAKEAEKAGDSSQLKQEYNLLYVAETRTKHTLINCDLQDFTE